MKNKPLIKILTMSLVLVLSACTTIPVDQRAEIRDETDQVGRDTTAELVAGDPSRPWLTRRPAWRGESDGRFS